MHLLNETFPKLSSALKGDARTEEYSFTVIIIGNKLNKMIGRMGF